MLTRFCPLLLIVCFILLATPILASAQVASGQYKFVMEDGFTKYLEFDARTVERGAAAGYMIFNDEASISFEDVDGTGDVPREEPVAFFMKADWETMTVEKNRAIINGVVRDSSYRSYIGKFVQLVIEDNDGIEVPDKFVWSFCTPEPGGWIPEDAEVRGDKGAFLSWWATDAERKDDVGIPSPSLIPGSLKSCKVQPLPSYEFATFLKGDGAIQIKQ
jgi:hypothetical protein